MQVNIGMLKRSFLNYFGFFSKAKKNDMKTAIETAKMFENTLNVATRRELPDKRKTLEVLEISNLPRI